MYIYIYILYIYILQQRVSSSFVFSILFYEETINTYWMLVKDFIYIYILYTQLYIIYYIYTCTETVLSAVRYRSLA